VWNWLVWEARLCCHRRTDTGEFGFLLATVTHISTISIGNPEARVPARDPWLGWNRASNSELGSRGRGARV